MVRSRVAESRLDSQLRRALAGMPATRRYWIAYSGGRDSSVLLHAVHRFAQSSGATVVAAHVHHGLHPQADAWARFCRRTGRALGISLRLLRVDARPPAGESPEDWARRCRYEALAGVLDTDDTLLTAHHRQDQAETLLLQLMRGAGPAGLAGMPAWARFGKGWHGRPLLDCPVSWIAEYAQRHGLEWCDDQSNADRRYARNFVRHELIPVLARRWPGFADTIARAADWQAEAAELQGDLAAIDLAAIVTTDRAITTGGLGTLSPARQRNAVRAWVSGLRLPLPNARHVEEVIRMAAIERTDSVACVRWPGAEVRRYRDALHAMAPLPEHDARRTIAWNPDSAPVLPMGRLVISRRSGGVADRVMTGKALSIRFRQGGERLLLSDGHRHSLKTLLQDRGLAPWLRRYLPLFYCGEEIAAVPGVGVNQRFRAAPGEEGWGIEWRL